MRWCPECSTTVPDSIRLHVHVKSSKPFGVGGIPAWAAEMPSISLQRSITSTVPFEVGQALMAHPAEVLARANAWQAGEPKPPLPPTMAWADADAFENYPDAVVAYAGHLREHTVKRVSDLLLKGATE